MRLRLKSIDLLRHTNILHHYEWLCNYGGSGKGLANMQAARLTNLLYCLREHNKLYKPILSRFKPEMIETDPREIIRQMPIMDKKSINLNSQYLKTRLPDRFEQSKKTGGSTGEPFKYWIDAESTSLSWAYIYFCWHKYANFIPGDHFVTIAGNSLQSSQKTIIRTIYCYLQNNYLIPADSICSNMSFNLKQIKRAKLIYAYPTTLYNLLILNPSFSSLFSELRAIFTTSEQLHPAVRLKIEKDFGLEIFDMYGANDGGLISCESTDHEGYFYHPLNCYVEELENDIGFKELLLTSINCWTYPLVRYRVGDLANAEQPGQTEDNVFPLIHSLKGRTRDLIHLPSGIAVHGSAFNSLFFKFPNVGRYRIIQQPNKNLLVEVQLVDENNYISQNLENEIKILVHNEIAVEVRTVQSFPVTDLKFKVIESHAN